jgi:DNA polymerase V
MQIIQPVKRGGRRVGAGRPKGSGRYGETTVTVRVPKSKVGRALHIIEGWPTRLPLIVVGKPSEKPGQ